MLELALALLLASEEPKVPATPATPEAHAPTATDPRAPSAPEPAPSPPATPTLPDAVPRGAPATTSDHGEPAAPPRNPPDAHPGPKPHGGTAPAPLAESTDALVRAQAASESSLPPALTGKALTDELKRSARERMSDRTVVQAERLRLEALAKEIAEARAALRQETAKLETLVARGGKGSDGARGSSTLDTLARTVKGMKPADAAALLSRVDRPLSAAILEQMRPEDAARVIGKMDPAMGAALFGLLARADAGRKP